MAALAVFMMISVALVPAISILTDDQGVDAAYSGSSVSVTVDVTDAGSTLIPLDFTMTAVVTAQGGLTYQPTVTNSGGHYTFTINNVDEKVVLTITNGNGYTFTTATKTISRPASDGWTATTIHTFVANEYTVSGTVTAAGSPVSGVTVSYNTASTTTNSAGMYYIAASAGSTVTINGFSKTGVTFPTGAVSFTEIYSDMSAGTVAGNTYTVYIQARDAGSTAIAGVVTFTYTLNGGSAISVTSDSSGKATIYANAGDSVKVASAAYSGSYTFATMPDAVTASSTTIYVTATEYTMTISVADSTSTPKDVSGITVAAAAVAGVTFVKQSGVTDSTGKAYITYKKTDTTAAGANILTTVTVTATSTFAFATPSNSVTIVANGASAANNSTTSFTSSAYMLTGLVTSADSTTANYMFAGAAVQVTGVNCLINGATVATVTVDADGNYSFYVTETTVSPTVQAKVTSTTNAYGFTYDVSTPGSGAISAVITAASTVTVTQLTLKAVQNAVTITGAVRDSSSSAQANALVNYKVNGNTGKAVVSTATVYTIYVAAGASVNEIQVDTVTQYVVGTTANYGYGKVFSPTSRSLSTVNTGATDIDFQANVTTATITVSVTGPTTSSDFVTLQYTVGTVTKTVSRLGSAASFSISVDKGSSVTYTVAAKDYVTVTGTWTSINSDVTKTVAMVQQSNAVLTVTGTTSAGDGKALTGIVVEYQLSDTAITTPSYDQTATTDADGKVTIAYTTGQYLAYKVDDTGLYTFARTDAASGLGNDTAVTFATQSVAAEQDGYVNGYIRTASGVAISNVNVGFEIHVTSASTGVATATVKTDSNGMYFIPVKNDGSKAVTIYPTLSGYVFGATTAVTPTDSFTTSAIGTDQTLNIYGKQISGLATVSVASATSGYTVSVVGGGDVTTSGVVVEIGDVLVLSADESIYSTLGTAGGAAGNAIEKLEFVGWSFNGVMIEDSTAVMSYTVAEGGVFEAVYEASVTDSTPVTADPAGVDNIVIIICVIAVLIALIAVVYAVMSAKKQ